MRILDSIGMAGIGNTFFFFFYSILLTFSPRGEGNRVTRYIDDIFGGSNINSVINQSGCLGERARSDLLVGRYDDITR